MRSCIALLVAFVLAAGVLPTAADAYPSGGALPPVLTLDIAIAGLDGVPIDAAGVALNVTVTNPAAAGFLTVYPCGAQRPTASNLNYVADQTVPNFVIAALSPDGDVCIDTMTVVDIVVDLAGYLPAGSPVVTLPEPKRIVDSRLSQGVAHRLSAGDVATVQIAGNAGVPPDASMVLVNTTAVDTSTPGFITVFPCGEAIPATSTLNFTADAIVPNFVLARIGTGGQVCVFTMSPTDLVMDVAGYVPAGVGEIVPLSAPARLLDTRDGTGGPVSPIGVTASAPLAVASPRAHVRDDCEHIDVVGDTPPNYSRGWVLNRAGAVLQSYQLSYYAFNVLFTSVGPLMVRNIAPMSQGPGPTTAVVEDAITHDVLFTLPELSMSTDGGYRFRYPLGATDDVSLLALRYDTVDRLHSVVSYWTIDGLHVGDLQLATGYPRGMSPSGTYISYAQSTDISGGDIVVATLDGVEVARTHLAFMDLYPVWMSDGAITFCQPAQFLAEHQLRWDLFSPQRLFIPGDPFQSCLLDAR